MLFYCVFVSLLLYVLFFAPQRFQKYNVNVNKVRKDGIFYIIYFSLVIWKTTSFRALILSLLEFMEINSSININNMKCIKDYIMSRFPKLGHKHGSL